MRSVIAVLAAAAVVTGAGAGAASAEPCNAANVVGTWSLVSVQAAEPGVQAFYERAPYEWMRFKADGSVHYVASTRDRASRAEIEAMLDRTDAQDGTDYIIQWLDTGVMLMLRDGQPFQLGQCQIAATDDGPVRAGDLIYTNVEGMPSLRRIQRRLAD
jgi:hypothetical protein